MEQRALFISGRSILVFALACASLVAAAATQPLLKRLLGPSYTESVRVTGLALPHDSPDEMLVYTDRGVFTVNPKLSQAVPRGELWFLFRIGGRYQVVLKGAEYKGLWGHFLPTIEHFSPERQPHVADLGGPI